MEQNRGTKIIAIVALCFAVAGISLAYAAMNTTLTIKGSATMDTAKWSIKFKNLLTDTDGAASFTTNPQITGDITIGDYAVTLTKPGDTVTLTFDVANDGTLDANLDQYTLGALTCESAATPAVEADATTVCGNLSYTLTYTNATTAEQTGTVINAGTAVAKDQKLLAGKSVNLTLTLTYKSDATTLPSDDVNIEIGDTTLYYEQA